MNHTRECALNLIRGSEVCTCLEAINLSEPVEEERTIKVAEQEMLKRMIEKNKEVIDNFEHTKYCGIKNQDEVCQRCFAEDIINLLSSLSTLTNNK